MLKKLLVSILVLSLSFSTIVDARSFGGGSSAGRSFSSARSYSAPARSYSSPSSTYSRPATPAYSPAPVRQPTVINQYNQPAANNGPGWGGVAAGALGGYLVGQHANQPVVANPGYAQQPQQAVQQQNPEVYTPAAQSYNQSYTKPVQEESWSVWSLIGSVLKGLYASVVILILLVGTAWCLYTAFMWVRNKWDSSKTVSENITGLNVTPKDILEETKERLFSDFQLNNRPSGKHYIISNTTSLMYNSIRRELEKESEDKDVYIKRLEANLISVWQEGHYWIGSVEYSATIVEDTKPEVIHQIWNFEFINNKWKLAGIEVL